MSSFRLSSQRTRPPRLLPPADRRALRRMVLLGLAVLAIVGMGAYAVVVPRLLVVDKPRRADVIVVLAGDEEIRSQRAIELLRQGYAPRAFIDTVDWTAWGVHGTDLARQYLNAKPDVGHRIELCTMDADSTRTEALAAAACLQSVHARTVLLVTSDFHTRRALTIFRHELPQYDFAVAAWRDPDEYGTRWWTHRVWAVNFWKENVKLLWFTLAYRWRE